MPSAQDQSSLGSFASVIELRAYMQAEFERVKGDVDKIYSITTQIREDEARREERLTNFQRVLESLQQRVDALGSAVERLKTLDGNGIYVIIAEELSSFKKELEMADLRKQIEETRNPVSLHSMRDSISKLEQEMERKSKEVLNKSEEEKKFKTDFETLKTAVSEMKVRMTIIISVAVFILTKGAELLFKYVFK